MLRGEISPEEFAVSSGAVAEALRHAGIDPDALREVSNEMYQTKWKNATEDFLAGSDWPGGQANMKRLGETILEMGMTDNPSAETLTAAYKTMRDKNLVAPNEETKQAEKDRECAHGCGNPRGSRLSSFDGTFWALIVSLVSLVMIGENENGTRNYA